MTDDDGSTAAITYTVVNPPDTTVTLVATGFITAWNASTNPLIAGWTATQSAGQVILTSDTVGIPGSFATSGTGTWSGAGNTTANVGNTDYGTDRNWSTDLVPVATNDVLFDVASTNVNVTYGLGQSSIAIADFRVFSGCSSTFGRFDNGVGHYLIIDPDLFRYEGSGSLAMFNIGSANIAAYIKATGTAATSGRHAVYFKGSNVTTLTIDKGNVGIAVLDGDTATIATIKTGYVSTQASDVALTLGSGLTLTTLDQGGGTCVMNCAATTATNGYNSTLTTDGTGAITTLHVYGTCYANSTGTITTANVYSGATLDLTKSKAARTVTTINAYPGSTVIYGSWITVTTNNDIRTAGSGTITRTIRA